MGEVIARATFRGRDELWQINLTNKFTASFSVQLNRLPAGSIKGDFRFYDTEVADKSQLERFLELPKRITSPEPSVHLGGYEIALAMPATNTFHAVEVWFHRDMQRSEGLVLFFSVWRNIWNGVPGYPRAPGEYAG